MFCFIGYCDLFFLSISSSTAFGQFHLLSTTRSKKKFQKLKWNGLLPFSHKIDVSKMADVLLVVFLKTLLRLMSGIRKWS